MMMSLGALEMQSKKNNRNIKKKAQYLKRARNGMLGFCITWIDTDPFSDNGEIHGGHVDHQNPTQRLICRDMWAKCAHWIVETEFTWKVLMRVVFENTQNGTKFDDYEFTYTCSLRGKKSEILNNAMEKELNNSFSGNDAYPEGHKNKGTYLHCEFLACIVGV